MAALKGIDLEAQGGGKPRERFEEIKRRAEAQALGLDGIEQEVYGLGIGVEIEED